jgi:tRNA(fMet)-specific endonuclease VapC
LNSAAVVALLFLLDTNVVSELSKPVPDGVVLSVLQRHEAACAISAPTLEELTFGCARLPPGQRQAWLRRWLAGLAARIVVLPYDRQAASWLGAERARLAALGRPAPRTEGEIASIAVTQGLTLVTRNLKDLRSFEGLALADWFASATPGSAAPP